MSFIYLTHIDLGYFIKVSFYTIINKSLFND